MENKEEKETKKMGARIDKLNSTGKFDLEKNEVKIGKKKKKVLKTINETKDIDYLGLLRLLDIKPSRLDKKLKNLVELNLITLKEDKIIVTDYGMNLIKETKNQKENKEDFKDFVEALDEKEFTEFCNICESLNADIKEKEKKSN